MPWQSCKDGTQSSGSVQHVVVNYPTVEYESIGHWNRGHPLVASGPQAFLPPEFKRRCRQLKRAEDKKKQEATAQTSSSSSSWHCVGGSLYEIVVPEAFAASFGPAVYVRQNKWQSNDLQTLRRVSPVRAARSDEGALKFALHASPIHACAPVCCVLVVFLSRLSCPLLVLGYCFFAVRTCNRLRDVSTSLLSLSRRCLSFQACTLQPKDRSDDKGG